MSKPIVDKEMWVSAEAKPNNRHSGSWKKIGDKYYWWDGEAGPLLFSSKRWLKKMGHKNSVRVRVRIEEVE